MSILKLTKYDQDVLLDRLEGVPDALAECMRDAYEDYGLHWSCRYAEDGIAAAGRFVEAGGGDVQALDRHARWALLDAWEGSTWPSRLRDGYEDGEISRSQYTRESARLRALDARVEQSDLPGMVERDMLWSRLLQQREQHAQMR